MSPITILKAASILTIATGLASLAGAHPATSGAWALLFDIERWPIDGAQGAFSDEARLLNAVLGGVMAGWGVMMWRLVSGPITRGDSEARQTVLIGTSVWFVLDSAGSIISGWPANVALNIGFYALFLFPLLALGRTDVKSGRG